MCEIHITTGHPTQTTSSTFGETAFPFSLWKLFLKSIGLDKENVTRAFLPEKITSQPATASAI